MQLEQSFTLPFAAAAVWPAFADVPMLVACMPGASLSGESRAIPNDALNGAAGSATSGADIDLVFTVRLGPITGAFQGQGTVRRDNAAKSGTFSGNGVDRKSGSRVKGEAKFSLTEAVPGQTRVDVTVEYSLTGALAQFSRGAIVKELTAALTRDFAANLRDRIAAAQPAAAAAAPAANGASTPAPVSGSSAFAGLPAAPVVKNETAPLNAGRLFWRVMRARIAGWFGRAAP